MIGFTDKQIVSMLGVHSLWSKRACREILGRPGDFIPLLIDILDKTMHDPESLDDEGDAPHIPAAMLLAQMREPQAYSRLVDLINYDEDSVDYLWGDILTEQYVSMLRDTFNGDSSLLPRLIENRSAWSHSRAMAIIAWGMHYFDGRISRDEIVRYFRRLIHEVYTGKPDDDDITVLSYIADCAREQRLEELIEDVLTIYARGGIDEFLCESREEYGAKFSDPLYGPTDLHIDDVIRELEKWQWFKEKTSSDDEDDEDDYDDVLLVPKIGRNEPCPCGSGKKYKNCCL